jgi:hypothetical protein
MNGGTRRGGFTLVFVLLMLAICGALGAQYASKVIRLNGQANNAEREMQSRWAVLSLRNTMLESPQFLLAMNQRGSEGIRTVVRLRIRLSGKDYATQLEDESAKLPVNALLKSVQQDSLRDVLREVSDGKLPLKIVIAKDASNWSQVFEVDGTLKPRDSLWALQRTVPRLTLHSDGLLNIRLCDAKTLNGLWKSKLGIPAPKEIHDLRLRDQVQDIQTLVGLSGLSRQHGQILEEYCTLQSSTYSLWIDATNQNGFGFTAIYIRRTSTFHEDQHFGFHSP